MTKNHGNKEGTAAGWTIGVIAFKAGTHRDVSRCIPRHILASLGQVDVTGLTPCSCKIKRVVVENPLSRVGHTQVAAFGAFSRHPLPLNQWTKTFFAQGWTHTHRAVFGAVKVVVRPGASSSVLTPRGTFVQKAPNCWRNEELVDT